MQRLPRRKIYPLLNVNSLQTNKVKDN